MGDTERTRSSRARTAKELFCVLRSKWPRWNGRQQVCCLPPHLSLSAADERHCFNLCKHPGPGCAVDPGRGRFSDADSEPALHASDALVTESTPLSYTSCILCPFLALSLRFTPRFGAGTLVYLERRYPRRSAGGLVLCRCYCSYRMSSSAWYIFRRTRTPLSKLFAATAVFLMRL